MDGVLNKGQCCHLLDNYSNVKSLVNSNTTKTHYCCFVNYDYINTSKLAELHG